MTHRGWALLGMAAAAVAAGYLVGLAELYPLAAAAVVLVISAKTWVGARSWDVRGSRTIRPARVPAGGEARVAVSVRNYDSRRSPLLVVRDSFDDGGLAGTFALAPLAPGESRSEHYRLPAPRRGVLQCRPLEIELTDPFGLVRAVRTAAPAASLTIHPKVDLVPHDSIPSDSERDQRVPVPLLGRGGDEFYALREYQIGDDLRQVHWVSTARTDELMIRQPQNLWRGRTTVVVDARSYIHDHTSFEEALSAAASVAVSALRGGMQVGLVIAGGQQTAMGMGAGHEGTVLDTLAVASLTEAPSLASELRTNRVQGPVVLVTTDSATGPDMSSAIRAAGRSESMIVVVGRRTTASRRSATDAVTAVRSSRGARCKVVHVGAGLSFSDAWVARGDDRRNGRPA